MIHWNTEHIIIDRSDINNLWYLIDKRNGLMYAASDTEQEAEQAKKALLDLANGKTETRLAMHLYGMIDDLTHPPIHTEAYQALATIRSEITRFLAKPKV